MNYMELGPMRFMSPSSAPLSEQPPIVPEIPHIGYERILNMDGPQLFDYIRKDLVKSEHELYGETDTEAKLVFAGGSLADDISKMVTFEGRTVYAKPPKYVKDSEAVEFLSMASRVLNEDGDIVEFVSEAADLFYNYSFLAEIDKDMKHRHAPNYIHLMSQIAGALGWTQREALLVAAVKYHRRFVEKKEKDPKGEKVLISELLELSELRPPIIPTPNFDQVNDAHGVVSNITKVTLRNRYKQVIEEKRIKASGATYPSWS